MKNDNQSFQRGAGGTQGGIIEFFVGAIMIMAGGYMFLSRVIVTTTGFGFRFGFGGFGDFAVNDFGLALMPLLIGIGILFFRGRSILGWLLTIGGAVIIVMGVLLNLDIYFQRTNLFNTLFMLGLIAGGLGLVARALQHHEEGQLW